MNEFLRKNLTHLKRKNNMKLGEWNTKFIKITTQAKKMRELCGGER